MSHRRTSSSSAGLSGPSSNNKYKVGTGVEYSMLAAAEATRSDSSFRGLLSSSSLLPPGTANAAEQPRHSLDLRRQSTSAEEVDDIINNHAGLHSLSAEHLATAVLTNGSSSSSPSVPGANATTPSEEFPHKRRSHHQKHHHQQQTLLTKALLSYLNFFRIIQPLASLAVFGTITPVLTYFRTQTIFPTIQATLYVYTDTLACCSLLFSVMYLIDVLYHKPLFWPFTNRHFRQTSKARIGGDLIVCMLFCGLWFLALIGLVIDALFVDCGKLTGLESVFLQNHQSVSKIKTICQLEKATLGLSIVCWSCWMGVLLVLLYGHFWKRRQIITERLRDRLSRRTPSGTGGVAGVSTAISPEGASQAGSLISGRIGAGATGSGTGVGIGSGAQHPSEPSDCSCQSMDGEVGLTGIICNYDDDNSTVGQNTRRGDRPHVESIA
ncbi:hypothetical protein BGX28_008035 [Mortierella sp. GBA30]|nr:hypothetical protein BGX28_008035 [Mortierella sp. GBA30]